MKKLLTGNEAIARGAYESGVKVATGYPGTPSTEIIETLSKFKEVYVGWSVNEKTALEIAFGSSYAGKRALVAMKNVGLNLAADPLFTISYTGINAGLVIVVVDDPGIFSSQNEQDSRNYAKFAKIPMLEPSDSEEAKDFVKKAFEISEKYDTPVLIRSTTRVSHSKGIVNLGKRKEVIKRLKKNIEKYVMMPIHARKRHKIVEERLEKLSRLSEIMNKIEIKNKNMGFITSGISYQYLKEIFPNSSFLKLNMSYPIPKRLVEEFSKKVKKLYVVEELDPFIEEQIKSLGIKVKGKEIFPLCGELTPDIIKEKFLNKRVKVNEKEVKERLPNFCPGCPHVPIFKILKKLKLHIIGDVGCYTLAALPPLKAMYTQLNMGLSLGAAFGVEKALNKRKDIIAVIGDSTFVHSGITSLIDIIYNKGITKIIILNNSITAMTGNQVNPCSGFTIKGEKTKKLDLKRLCKAMGVNSVRIVNPYRTKETEKTIKQILKKKEPVVIITNQPCMLTKR